jgi:hypothetical protein
MRSRYAGGVIQKAVTAEPPILDSGFALTRAPE